MNGYSVSIILVVICKFMFRLKYYGSYIYIISSVWSWNAYKLHN